MVVSGIASHCTTSYMMMILMLLIVAMIENPMTSMRTYLENASSGHRQVKNVTTVTAPPISTGKVNLVVNKHHEEDSEFFQHGKDTDPPSPSPSFGPSICDSLDENMELLLSIMRGEEVQVYEDTEKAGAGTLQTKSLIELDENGYQMPFASDIRVALPANNATDGLDDSSAKTLHIKGYNHEMIDRVFRKKRIYFIGDSTSRNLFVALRRLLNFIQFGTPAAPAHRFKAFNISNTSISIDNHDGLNYSQWTQSLALLFMKEKKKWKKGNSLPAYMIRDGTHIQVLDVNSLYFESPEQVESNQKTNLRDDFVNLTQRTLFNPDVIVFNAGLHLLQLIPHRKLNHYMYTGYIEYESILQTLLQVSMDSHAPAILAKSTNRVCDKKMGPDYKDHNKKYKTHKMKTLKTCDRILEQQEEEKQKEAKGKQENVTILSKSQRDEICRFGAFNDKGSSLLNNRMSKWVRQMRYKMANQTALSRHQGISVNSRLQYFNDHDIESCEFTRDGDGRHYEKQVFVRLHLLAIMLDCISP